jgi:wyosine [tRNA(Phe)-imidazoG37] synthetase (radical SAM superfamily)
MKAFGPVPSRRLGQSLGINNIPPKVCTYSCVYCQIGKTEQLSCERRVFFEPDDLAREVTEKVDELRKRGTRIDYLSFVPDGEPTLDIN